MKCKLHDEAGKLRDEMKSITFAFQDNNQRTFIPTDTKAIVKKEKEEKKEEELKYEDEAAEISYVIENVVIFAVTQCLNTTCNHLIREEEIMSGWQKSMNEYISQCPSCKAKFVPQLNLYTDSDHEFLNGKDGIEIQWLPPSCLLKEFTNCISQRGESILLKEDFRKDHKTLYWNLVFYFKLLKLPTFFLDQYYNPAHIFRQAEHLEPYTAVEKQKRMSTASRPTLNKDALNKLQEATRDQQFEMMVKATNRPPSLYEGVMGGMASDSIGVDTLSQTDSVAKPRRPGSVVNFGRGSSMKRSRRGSISQRSNSGSQVGSVSDLERLDLVKGSSSNANKYITRYFSKYWEEFRNFMHMKNQDIALAELNFDDMPEELAKQFSNVRKPTIVSLTSNQSEIGSKIPKEVNQDFKADEIISSLTMNKMSSTTNSEAGRFKPPTGAQARTFHKTGSPMKTIKKSKLKIKHSSRFKESSTEQSEY